MKFVFPEMREPDYFEMQKVFNNYEESIFVDDYIEVKNIIREMEMIDPERIQNEMVPRLKKLI